MTPYGSGYEGAAVLLPGFAITGNKTAAVSWPDPYDHHRFRNGLAPKPISNHWHLYHNTTIFIKENAFENVDCKMASILYCRPRHANSHHPPVIDSRIGPHTAAEVFLQDWQQLPDIPRICLWVQHPDRATILKMNSIKSTYWKTSKILYINQG